MDKKSFDRLWARQDRRYYRAERNAQRSIDKAKEYIRIMQDATNKQKEALKKYYERTSNQEDGSM